MRVIIGINFRTKATAFLLAVIIITPLLSSCKESDGSGYIFKYDIASNPRTLDPQTATDASALVVMYNMFEGLLKLDERGQVVSGVAGEYGVSSDGLLYTFYLREDCYWTDGRDFEARCTARDFLFAFRRLFSPATKSENAAGFFCIKNAAAVNSGSADMKQLGIRAIDDFTLEIALQYPNPNFPYLLTTAPAMPCSEEFFGGTGGRYGLSPTAVAGNGAFYLLRWNYDPYSTVDNNLVLRRNARNNDAERVFPYGLNFFIDEPDVAANLRSGAAHALLAYGDTAAELIDAGFSHEDFVTAVWGVAFNRRGALKNSDLRAALATAVNRDLLPGGRGLTITTAIVPKAVSVGAEEYRAIAGGVPKAVDIPDKRALLEKGLIAVGHENAASLELIIQADDAVEELAGYVTQQWQAELGFYCNIRVVSADDMTGVLSGGDYDLALVKISGKWNSPAAYLGRFSSGAGNSMGISSGELAGLLTNAERSGAARQSAEYFFRAEKLIVDSAAFIPLCFQTESFLFDSDCEGIIYNPFSGAVDFRNAKIFK